MFAALATLTFLATLWLTVTVGAALLEESGVKIADAFKGKPAQPPVTVVSARVRVRSQVRQSAWLSAQWRAAA